MFIKRQIGHQLRAFAILFLKLLQAGQLSNTHPSETAFPAGEGLFTNPQLAAHIATGVPASVCRKAYAICSSVKLDLFILALPFQFKMLTYELGQDLGFRSTYCRCANESESKLCSS